MVSLTLEELSNLENDALTERMDELIKAIHSEFDPYYSEARDMNPYVGPFLNTKNVQKLNPTLQRKALWMVFDFIIQLEYIHRFHSFQNTALDRQQFDKFGWKSPALYVTYMSQEQSAIIGSRVALERLMDLIFFIANDQELPKGDSKFGKFRDWLFSLPIDSNWFYLIPFLPWFRKHDEEFRTAEVHNGSKLKKYVLALEDMPSSLKNDAMDLLNILINIWRHMLQLFDDQRPSGLGGVDPSMDISWLTAYVQIDSEKLKAVRKSVSQDLNFTPPSI